MNLDLDFVRSQFPAFREPSLAGFAHFENAGGSYACGQAIDWLGNAFGGHVGLKLARPEQPVCVEVDLA